MSRPLAEVVAYLDSYLRTSEVPDYDRAFNGLQVEGTRAVERVVLAVDACQATIDRAAALGADLMIVHHGLFWNGLQPLVGRWRHRIARIIESGFSLYSSHLPLDCHPQVGNNAVLARMLEVRGTAPFGLYSGHPIGLAGTLETSRDALAGRLGQLLGAGVRLIACGPTTTRRVAVVTGAGGGFLAEARAHGIDTLITGEGAHHTYFDAEEWGINVLYAGHYATETVGVQALGRHLAAELGLTCEFVDHPTGL